MHLHQDVLISQISLTLSLSLSLSLTICAYQPSSMVVPVDGILCPHRDDFLARQPTLVCPCLGDHRRMLLMSLSLLLSCVCVAIVTLSQSCLRIKFCSVVD